MAKSDRVPFILRVLGWFPARLLSVGLPVGPLVLLNVRGRITGQLRATRVALIEHADHRWLAATYGDVNWVRNFRAARRDHGPRSSRAGDRRHRADPEAAGPLFKAAMGPHLTSRMIALFLRRYLQVAPDASLNDFTNHAPRHPVFELRRSKAAGGIAADIREGAGPMDVRRGTKSTEHRRPL